MSATPNTISRDILEKLTDDRLLITEQSIGEIMSVDPVVYGFDVGSVALMHDPHYQAEIVEDVVVTAIPNTQDWFMGMFVLRGYLIPAFDVGVLLGESKPASKQKITLAVIGANEEAAGINIASLPKRILPENLASEKTLDTPEFIKPAIRDLYSHENTPWLDLDYPYFFELLGEKVNKSYDQVLASETEH